MTGYKRKPMYTSVQAVYLVFESDEQYDEICKTFILSAIFF